MGKTIITLSSYKQIEDFYQSTLENTVKNTLLFVLQCMYANFQKNATKK